MKLSDAVVLGLGFVRFDPSLYLSTRLHCGCLLGAGFAAIKGFNRDSRDFVDEAGEIWPWILRELEVPSILGFNGPHQGQLIIGSFADQIERGLLTLEDALAWIRSVEPAEPVSTQTEGRDPVCSQTAEMERR